VRRHADMQVWLEETMAVKIRLRRMGSNKKPFFRVVVTDMRRPNAGRFIEALGWYDPKKKGVNYELRVDRIEYWRSKGAVVSDTVNSLLKKAKKAALAAAPPVAPAGA
jgi:small subunit ribosomal protein S16